MKFWLVTFLASSSLMAMTLNEAKDLAVTRSANLAAHEMEVRALKNETALRKRWQNPQIMSQIGTLKSGSVQGSTVEVTFTQPVPLSNKFSLREEIGKLEEEKAQSAGKFQKLWVEHQVTLTLWRVYLNHQLFLHGSERARRLALVKKYIESRPLVSIHQRANKVILESLLRQIEMIHELKLQNLEESLNDLEFWTGKKIKPDEVSLSIPEFDSIKTTISTDADKDIELIQAKNQLKVAELDAELARKERRPDLFLGAGYRVENVVPENHFTYGVIGINIPIWDTGHYRLEASRARLRKDEKIVQEIQRETDTKIQNLMTKLDYSLKQIKRFPYKSISSFENIVHDAEGGFKQGVLDVNTFVQIESQSHEIIDQVFLSWGEYLTNLSSLSLINGEELKWAK